MQFGDVMKSAMSLIREQRIEEATAAIQEGLAKAPANTVSRPANIPARTARVVRPLRESVDVLRRGKRLQYDFADLPQSARSAEHAVPEEAAFFSRSFSSDAGTRGYKLYVPRTRNAVQRPLLVMLHGCQQNPGDFAAGTRMNALADAHDMLVAYPGQTNSSNVSGCWNWFDPRHQQRGAGEPSMIAGLTREIVAAYDIDPARIFVAGLSAGGAMAVVMGETYPEIYAAIGVHSGLPYGSASDVVSAFEAMRGKSRNPVIPAAKRTIIFHGDADTTVHSSNGMNIAGARHKEHAAAADGGSRPSANGRPHTRTVTLDEKGLPVIEHWLIHGAGHAWSGGSAAGSYTDPKGPDASSEMIRFFLSNRKS